MYCMAHPGDLLQKLMDEHDISENALARATGVPQPTIHRILNKDSREPRRETLRPLARYFRIDVDDFFLETKAALAKPRPPVVDIEVARIAREITDLPPNRQRFLIRLMRHLLGELPSI